MTRQQFADALDAYGADFDRWPEALRSDARTLAASDGTAAAMFAAAARLGALLTETVRPVRVDSADIGRIMVGIAPQPSAVAAGPALVHEHTLRPNGRLFAWAGAAMAVFLVAGFVLGVALPASYSDDDDALAAILFGTGNGAVAVTAPSPDDGGQL